MNYAGPYQLLVATVLSAQTTDRRVNTVTPTLFNRWPGPQALADADIGDVETVVARWDVDQPEQRALCRWGHSSSTILTVPSLTILTLL
ncbi:endonuclease III [Cutibacterium acnes JCM 18909]|nr:endonuclease III [Cutibacterium acnes JCM 18909]